MNHKKLTAALLSIVTAATSLCSVISPVNAVDADTTEEQQFCAPISEVVRTRDLISTMPVHFSTRSISTTQICAENSKKTRTGSHGAAAATPMTLMFL